MSSTGEAPHLIRLGEVAAQEIAKLAAELANRIEKESTPGADLQDEITQPLPPLHDQMGAGQLNFGGREPPDPVRDLELRVETVSTNHGSAQIIRRGTESEVATWLRSPEAAVHIITVMKELAEHLARKGWA